MAKPVCKSRINTTIDASLLESLKILAAQEGKHLNQLLEEGIRYILDTYDIKSLVPTGSFVPQQERREHPTSLVPQQERREHPTSLVPQQERREHPTSLVPQQERREHPTSLVPQQERREHPRTEVSWPVSLISAQGSIEGTLKDISKGGALIQCKQLPKTEDSLELRIEIPDHFLNISATVNKVRLNINDSDTASYSYDLAVRFSGINVDQRKNLYNAIEHEVRRIGP